MSRVRCYSCGETANAWHHPTGRDGAATSRREGKYLDPMFVFPVCHDCHQLGRDDRYTLGLENVPHRLPFFERVEIMLRRIGADVARLADAHPDHPWFGKVAIAVVRWADELAAGIRRLDERDPSWREDPGFYPSA